MKYIEVKFKKTGATGQIMEIEFDAKQHTRVSDIKEQKAPIETKEEKVKAKTKAK